MKSVLILTVSTGEGHNQAAESLKEVFISKGYITTKFDFIKESNKFLNIFISDGYRILASKCPKLYGNLYKISDIKKFNSALLKIHSSKIESKILSVIENVKPDIIISTHAFAVSIICNLKKSKVLDVPFMSIVTDFKAHYAYVDDKVDAYITGSEYTKQNLLKKKVPKNKVFCYGIPIKRDFMSNHLSKMQNESNYFTILLMGGSMGMKSIGKVLKKLILNENSIKIIVVCGSNNVLKSNLEKKYLNVELKNKELNILGYTKEVPKLMELSDIIITKPGGLTVSEAIVKRLPMVIPFAIPGQEQENMEFLIESGAAIGVNDLDNLNKIIDDIINESSILENMKRNLDALSQSYSIDNIVDLAENLIENKLKTNSYSNKKIATSSTVNFN